MINEPMVRQVWCHLCGGIMFYLGQRGHEPEVRVVVETLDADRYFYAHSRCWDALMATHAKPK